MEAGTRSGRLVGVVAVVVVAGVAGLSLASSITGGSENGDDEGLPPTTGTAESTQASETTTGPELGSLAALPLPAQGQGHHFTPTQGCLGAWVRLGRQRGLAKVVRHTGQNSQEDIHIDHRSALYLGEDRAILSMVSTFRVVIGG